MKALGQDTLMQRCQALSKDDIYGLFYMVLGAMTDTEVWPTFYMILSEFLTTWETREVKKSTTEQP